MTNLSKFRSFVSLIDWELVGNLVAEGLKVFVAGIILVVIYTGEGIIATYKWLQPRLAQFLQHPGHTINNGPMAVYNESLEAVLVKKANNVQRFVVIVGSTILLGIDTIGEIRENLNTLGIKIQNRTVSLSWGFTVYEALEVVGRKVYIGGQLMK